MCSQSVPQFVVLTGPPGIGKTTLVKNICHKLKTKNLAVCGFFTEEVRAEKERVGFDVVTFEGNRSVLARSSNLNHNGPTVGKYAVDVKSFESCCLPIFESQAEHDFLVLDEVGKMELFSLAFKKFVSHCFANSKSVILATIPIAKGKPLPLVEMIRSHPQALVLTVNRNNRNVLTDEIVEHLIKAKSIGERKK